MGNISQLVGLRCQRCEQEVWSDGEGCFCPTCGTPHHHRCEQPDRTPATASRCPVCQCDLDNAFAVRFREEQRRQKEYPARRLANLILGATVLLQLIVLGSLAVGIWGIRSLLKLDRVVAWYIGAIWLVMMVLIEVVAISFYRRKRWAWTAAIAVFALSLPSLAGIVGLVLLLRPGVREEFMARPAGEGDAEQIAAADRPRE